jgi:cobyrinic acid a,c-diamide synthase
VTNGAYELKIPRVVVAGTHSGVGKTTVALGLMGVLRKKGRRVQGFKVGPDFLDTRFHREITGRPSRNLDSWMIPKARIPSIFASACSDADIAVIEGVMGVFDGLDGISETASTSEIAKVLQAPVLLVVDAWGLAASAAAVVLGYKTLDSKLSLRGVILNRVAGEKHAKMCADAITRHSKLPVLGAIPVNKEITLKERHLGLVAPNELQKAKALDELVAWIGDHVDIDKVEKLANTAGKIVVNRPRHRPARNTREKVVIGVARDTAFSFYYQEGLDALCEAGANLEFFSPLNGQQVPPAAEGLYIGGGYPEVFGSQLASNDRMLKSIAGLAEDGMPIYAECGGLMYFTKSISDLHGTEHRMVGVLDARTRMVNRLTLSYTLAQSIRPNLLTLQGDTVRGHEYHFSKVEGVPKDSRFAYRLKRGIGIGNGLDGWISYNILASYMHTNFAFDDRMARRFVESCRGYARK